MSPRFKINVEWQDPAGARGAELRATWARISILVGDFAATRVIDEAAGSVRDAVYAPAYPLAEWLAAHWWFLRCEADSSRSHFKSRHSLRWAGEGFALPDLSMLCDGLKCSLTMNPTIVPLARLSFRENFHATLDEGVVFGELRAFVESVCRRLEDQNVHGTCLQEDWKAIQQAEQDADESAFCQAAGALGQDPFAIAPDFERILSESHANVGDALWGEFVAVTEAASVLKASEWVKASVVNLGDFRTAKLRFNATDLPIKGAAANAWLEGYQAARELWKAGDLRQKEGKGVLDWEGVFENGDESIALNAIPHSESTKIDGLVHMPGKNELAIGKTKSRQAKGERFLLARAVGDCLMRKNGKSWSMLTRTQTYAQQRNRAFAAELLVPSENLKKNVSGSYIDDDEVEELAEFYGVSTWMMGHQLSNHRIAEII